MNVCIYIAQDGEGVRLQKPALATVLYAHSGQVGVNDDDDMLTPTGHPPPSPTQQPTWLTAHTAHRQHCSHTALPPGQKTPPGYRQPTWTATPIPKGGTSIGAA